MPIKVLVVDDSSFFRRRVAEILNQAPLLEVIDTASNGREAVEKVSQLKPDVITMDIEMPVMNGIDAVREIMKSQPTPVLMFSSLTHEGAKATLDALEAGALDFLPKKFEDIARDKQEAITLLQQRVSELSRRRFAMQRSMPRATSASAAPARGLPLSGRERTAPQTTAGAGRTTSALTARRSTLPLSGAARTTTDTAKPAATQIPAATAKTTASAVKPSGKSYRLLAIGTSTGGPVALQTILTKLPRNFPYPIVLVQHMPAAFTGAFAQRLDSLCQISVKEAETGDILKPGTAYLAPGGQQMLVDKERIKIIDGGDHKVNYKPSVDVTFATLAKSFGGDVLSVILTGMGADGRDGCRLLKQQGAQVWAQDEASCVVYGMPQAVAAAGISTQSIALDQMAESIMSEMKR